MPLLILLQKVENTDITNLMPIVVFRDITGALNTRKFSMSVNSLHPLYKVRLEPR